MPCDLKKYGKGWKQFSNWVRFERALGQCECGGECGLHRTHPGPRRCQEFHGQAATWARGKVILTVAHLCTCDPPCQNPAHVKAMCQRCHNRIDVGFRCRNRAVTRRVKRELAGQLRLDGGVLEG